MIDSFEDITRTLEDAEAAFTNFKRAKAACESLATLGGKVREKLATFIEELGPDRDPTEFNARYDAIPEEKEIRAILNNQSTTWFKLKDALRALRVALDPCRLSSNTSNLFKILDALPHQDSFDTPERQIRLAKLIVRTAFSPSHAETATGTQSRPPGRRSTHAPEAQRKLLEFKNRNGLGLKELRERMGGRVTEKTIGKLLKTGIATPSTLGEVAGALRITKEELLKGH